MTVWLSEDGAAGVTIAGLDLEAGDVVIVPMDATAGDAVVLRLGYVSRFWRRRRCRLAAARMVVLESAPMAEGVEHGD